MTNLKKSLRYYFLSILPCFFLADENELLKKQKEGDLKKALREEKNKRKDAEKLANSLLIERKKM